MEIQSASIAVPGGCLNACKFCVAHMHENQYPNRLHNSSNESYNFYLSEYKKRLEFVRDNGCNTIILIHNIMMLLIL